MSALARVVPPGSTGTAALVAAGAVAVLFGLATIWSGGQALFGSTAARAAAGNVVPFVLWFNFIAGFGYVLAGAGLLLRQRWAVFISIVIAIATIAVFAALGVHIAMGGAYEMRTVFAMVLRSAVWIAIALMAARFGWRRATTGPDH